MLHAFDRRLEQLGRADTAILHKPGEAKAVIELIVRICVHDVLIRFLNPDDTAKLARGVKARRALRRQSAG